MKVTLRSGRVHFILLAAIITLYWALMAANVWGGLRLLPSDGGNLHIPLLGTRELQISLWSRDTVVTFWPDATGSARRPSSTAVQSSGHLSVAIWYQDSSKAKSIRLALFKLPAWSLGLIALDLAIVALSLSVQIRRKSTIDHLQRVSPIQL